MTRLFQAYVGIDYSGAGKPTARIPGLKVYRAMGSAPPARVPAEGGRTTWNRKLVAEWLLERLSRSERATVGIDHAFSFPTSSLIRSRLASWDAFLEYFCRRWHTDQEPVRKVITATPPTGKPNELRLTERWTSSARSVFDFRGQGQVASSTHAGIPWLRWLRRELGGRVHFWPFDGFEVPSGKSIIAEVYPSLFSKRYSQELTTPQLTAHDRDAYAVCRWLQDRDERGLLCHYLRPPLSPEEQKTACLEGWILGLT
jgi:hypothetical protein